jgi:flagellar basal-body rod modification protein FlgD
MAIEGVSTVDNSVFNLQATGGDDLGKAEFLQLLTAQLQHQDPMNPQKDADFVAQLAQFSNLEQAISQNEKLEQLQMSSSALVSSTTTDLIGREVLAKGDLVTVRSGERPAPLNYALGENAADVSLRIMNSDGAIVRRVELGNQGAGSHQFSWDGRNDEGDILPTGMYRVEVMATDASGLSIESSTNVRGVVHGVTFDRGYPELLVGNSRIQPADIIEVKQLADEASADDEEEDADAVSETDGDALSNNDSADSGDLDLDIDFSDLMDGLGV